MSRRYQRPTWTWTNWTFGAWRARIGRRMCFGIDLGPLETVWREKKATKADSHIPGKFFDRGS